MAYRVYRHLLDNGEFKEQEILLGRVSCFFYRQFQEISVQKTCLVDISGVGEF